MRVVNRTRDILPGDKLRTARAFLSRLVGLLGTAATGDGEGLWILAATGTAPGDRLEYEEGGPA